jgi:hypothetical protein
MAGAFPIWNEHERCRVDSKPPARTPHMAQPGGGGPGYDPSRGRFIGTLRLGFQLMERLAFP